MIEANVDAIVGPSHHYGGLGVGNVASQRHAFQESSPKKAALEGLAKAELVEQLGIPQFFWLPPPRPRLDLLTQLGFEGDLSQQLSEALQRMPTALSACFSSAFMWAANSCTVTPSCDSRDGGLHITPANLISSWHRAFEAKERSQDMLSLLSAVEERRIHSALPSLVPLRDEGAANHMRLCDAQGSQGIHVFVHGEESGVEAHSKYLARQTKSVAEAIVLRHQLDTRDVFFLHQHPAALSAGVFHNDVIATSHQDLLIHHEFAFLEAESELQQLETRFAEKTGKSLRRICIADSDLPLADAVASYFFNSQILSPLRREGEGPRMVLVCPSQCEENVRARQVVDKLLHDEQVPVEDVHYVSLSESMGNGGGPACLRLRIPLTQQQWRGLNRKLRVNSQTLERLRQVIERYYPETLSMEQLTDVQCVEQIQLATEKLRSAAIEVSE